MRIILSTVVHAIMYLAAIAAAYWVAKIFMKFVCGVELGT